VVGRRRSSRTAWLDGFVDEGDDPLGQVVDGVELAVSQQAALEDGEEQLDPTEPRGVRRGVVQEDVGPALEEGLDFGREVR
jgi:hypothetical protein